MLLDEGDGEAEDDHGEDELAVRRVRRAAFVKLVTGRGRERVELAMAEAVEDVPGRNGGWPSRSFWRMWMDGSGRECAGAQAKKSSQVEVQVQVRWT